MHPWIEQCDEWVTGQYKTVLSITTASYRPRFRWLSADSLTHEVPKAKAEGMVVEDSEIGWLIFFLPYRREHLERQVSESLGVRSRLLIESNYTGNGEPSEKEDSSSWRVGLTWLVDESDWSHWQRQVLELRRESGAAEEVSLDAVRIIANAVKEGLDSHGCPRLLVYTRALIGRTSSEAVSWLTADDEVAAELKDFSKRFNSARAREFARELEKYANTFKPRKSRALPSKPRLLERFRVKHFRNIEALEIVTDSDKSLTSQCIVLFGPNGTGKSSLAEALSLAAFGTSPRMEQFLGDRDLNRRTTQNYHDDYLAPMNSMEKPTFVWNKRDETSFVFHQSEESAGLYEGVVLNQEDSLKFTSITRQELAAVVVKGYSELADHVSGWLLQEEKRTKERKDTFTRKHGLNSAIKLSETAYDRLAQVVLRDQLKRPSPEFLSWLDFLSRLSDEMGQGASQLVSAWRSQQSNVVPELATTLAKLRASGGSETDIAGEIREKLEYFDDLAARSEEFRLAFENRSAALREQLDASLSAMDTWGEWLAAKKATPARAKGKIKRLLAEADELSKARSTLEKRGKLLRGRSDLLQQVQTFLVDHWAADHPNTCPTCSSDVTDRNGIKSVVSGLQAETNETLEVLRRDYTDLQNQQKDLAIKLQSAGDAAPPIPIDEQARLIEWLAPFLTAGTALEESLSQIERRRQLKADLSRMKIIPSAPGPYSNAGAEAERLAHEFNRLSEEADQALEGPQAIGEVKKTLEQQMEKVLMEHLPTTIGRVWMEITLALTTAAWVLPALPELKIEQRGKALSVRVKGSELLARYIYNAAERHVFGLAWFFTYYLARRRFEEAWMLLDDPAQEMDQPSFRELMRFCETLLRLTRSKGLPLTMILGLHQEERALDAARATSGRLYMLGWQMKQDDSSDQSSVRKMVLLAPGFHPLKPEMMFQS